MGPLPDHLSFHDMLKSFLKNNGISKVHYECLRASLNSTRPALFYGRTKIHKLDVPLRPIVSCIGSALYNTSRHLADILSSLVGKTTSFVRNSSHFSDIVQQEVIEQNDLLVSFDVKALYTSIPVEEAIRIAEMKLKTDSSWTDKTSLSVENVIRLLNLCLCQSAFKF